MANNPLNSLPFLGADPHFTTISGISSGGFMAVQMHVAFSETFKGVGVIAGGPYYCAKNSSDIAFTNCLQEPDNINVE